MTKEDVHQESEVADTRNHSEKLYFVFLNLL